MVTKKNYIEQHEAKCLVKIKKRKYVIEENLQHSR